MQKRLLLLLHYYYFQFQSSEFIGNAQYAQQGIRNGTVSVHLSVPARAHSSKPAAAGLLLWARRAGDISRLLHAGAQQQRRADAGSATLSAYVGC